MLSSIEKFDNAVKTYLAEMKAVGLSGQTIKNYSVTLNCFRDYLHDVLHIEGDPTPDNIRSYRNELIEKGLSKSTIRQYLVELNIFFNFCCDEDFNIYEKNPISKKMYPKITSADDKIYKKILLVDDFKRLWKNKKPHNYPCEKWERNYAMTVLLLDSKIRNSELRDIRLKDIDLDNKEIHIRRGKGGKQRWVTISDISVTAIKIYLNSKIRPSYCTDDDYLFGRESNGIFEKGKRQWLSKFIDNHVHAVTGKEGFRSHSLRHNGAILDLNTGTLKERLQAELGHSSILTTEIYSGRLQSVRKTRDYYKIANTRDECAKENMKILENMESHDSI